MARTVSYTEYPYIVWQIKGLPSVQYLNTDYFYYEGSRFYLSLQQEINLDVENDFLAMTLEEWGNWVEGRNNFLITTCVRDNYGRDCFVQSKEVSVAPLENNVEIWRMKRRDLVSKYSDFSTDNVVTFICTVGPHEMNGVNQRWNIVKENKSVQASLTPGERCTHALLDDFLNLLENGQEVDVVLKCSDGSRFLAHKAVLSARSEVFAAMFRNNMSESENGVVNIVDISPFVLSHFLKYLYCGRVDGLSDKTSSLLYAIGDKYAVVGLKKLCADYMVRNASRTNVFDFVTLADTHSDDVFRDSLISFISQNDSLLKEKIWLDFWKRQPDLAFRVYKDYVGTRSSHQV